MLTISNNFLAENINVIYYYNNAARQLLVRHVVVWRLARREEVPLVIIQTNRLYNPYKLTLYFHNVILSISIIFSSNK